MTACSFACLLQREQHWSVASLFCVSARLQAEDDWYIREIGLFGRLENETEEVLIAAARHPETWKPLLSSGSGKDIVVKFIFAVHNADIEKIDIAIDPSLVLASVAWTEENFVNVVDMLGHASATNQRILENAEEIGLLKTFLWSSS